MKVRVQYRFLFKLFALVTVVGLLTAGIHRWQVYRNSFQILAQARKAVAAGNQVDAVRYYTQYLGLQFDSAEAQVELADIFIEQGNHHRAFLYLEDALRTDRTLLESRKTLVKVAMDLDRPADAKENLASVLVPNDPTNAEYRWLLGLCEYRLGEFAKADEQFQLAVDLDGRNPIYASSRAELLRDRLNAAADGRDVLNKLIDNAPENPDAFLARGRWLLAQAQTFAGGENGVRDALLETAWQDAQTANQLAASVPQNVMFLVDVAVAQNRAADVRDAVQAAIQASPAVAELYGSAAQIELTAAQPKAAIKILQDGLIAIPGSPALLFNLAQLQLDSGNMPEGEKLIAELKSRKFDEAPIRYLESRVLANKGHWRQAATLLEQSRAMFDRNKALLKQADFLISLCYRNLGNPDQEMEALRRAIGADPLWASARESLANAFLRSGRVQESLAEFEQIVQQPNPPVSAVLSLARLRFIDGLGRNASGDQWNPLRQVLTLLESVPEAANDLAILRAELLVVENESAAAETLLKARLVSEPSVPELNQALISLQIRNQAWDDVERSLDAAQQNMTDSVTVRLERARYKLRRFGKQVDMGELETLAIPDQAWDSQQRLQLAAGFASYFLSLADYERGQKFARMVADSDLGQANLSAHLLLFELAFRSNDATAMSQSLEQVKKIEGTGPLWRVGEAIRLSVEAKQLADASHTAGKDASDASGASDALYAKAFEQLAEAALARPSWPRIARLKGEIHDQQNRLDLAMQSYLDAIRLGEQSPQMVARAIFLLFEKGRFAEADEVVRKLQEQKSPFSSELTRVASQVSLELENFDRALNLANDWAMQSDQQEDHVWLAQIHSSLQNYVKAEEEFRIAIEKDRSAPGPWVSLVQMFGRMGDTQAATKVINEAATAIRAEDRDSALAQAYQSIQDRTNAARFYKKAMETNADDVNLMRRYADFCLTTGQETTAEPILLTLISAGSMAADDDKLWARRALAVLYGFRGTDEQFKKARELLAQNTNTSGPTAQDQRTLALILSTRSDRPSMIESMNLLAQIAKQEPQFSLTDNFLLAKLYLRIGDWTNYSKTMRSVLGNGGAADSTYVRSYAESLVEKGELGEAELWFNRLKTLAPMELSTATIEAQLLFRSSDYDRLFRLVEANRSEPERLLWAAQTAESGGTALMRSGQTLEAQKFLEIARQCFAEIANSDPQQTLALASYHARRGEIKKSIELLQTPKLPPDEVGDLIQAALQSGSFNAEDARELIGALQSVQTEHPRHVAINLGLGDLWSWLEMGTEASSAYHRALQVDPNNIPALNNLATVLALSSRQFSEANRHIEHAVNVAGPTDYLLDTRGLVRFASGDIQGAEQDFRNAIEVSPRADRFFHLAQVLASQNRREEMRAAMKKAEAGGLTVGSLHPLERKAFESLVEQH